MTDFAFAFLLAFFAGFATGIGGLIALVSKKNDFKFMSICMAFAAGVMIYVSFTDIFIKSIEALEYQFENYMFVVSISFFAGVLLMVIINKLLPNYGNVDSQISQKEGATEGKEDRELKRAGIMTAISVALHNLPEGFVVFLATLYYPPAGIAVAIGIAIHNIPEGIAIASPIFYATNSRAKAFLAAFASGLTEPLGALLGYFLLSAVFTYAVEGISFALVGGIMVYIAFDKMLPISQKFAKHSTVILSLFAGMAVMAISIVLIG